MGRPSSIQQMDGFGELICQSGLHGGEAPELRHLSAEQAKEMQNIVRDFHDRVPQWV
jgi:hypothetical protein